MFLPNKLRFFLSRLNFKNDFPAQILKKPVIFLCRFRVLDQRHINSGEMAPKKRISSGGENQRGKLPKVCAGDASTEYILELTHWCLGLSWTSRSQTCVLLI